MLEQLAAAEGIYQIVFNLESITLRTQQQQLAGSLRTSAAIEYLEKRRGLKKRWSIIGNSKVYKWHEMLRALEVAITEKESPSLIEPLLRMVEAEGITDHPDEDDTGDDGTRHVESIFTLIC